MKLPAYYWLYPLILQFECTFCLCWWEFLSGKHHNIEDWWVKQRGLVSMLQQKRSKVWSLQQPHPLTEFMKLGCLYYTCKFDVTLRLARDWISLMRVLHCRAQSHAFNPRNNALTCDSVMCQVAAQKSDLFFKLYFLIFQTVVEYFPLCWMFTPKEWSYVLVCTAILKI